MIEFQNVSLCLNGKMILQNVSFYVEKGESILLVGSSGAGKSTILKLALGLIKPTYGSVFIIGENIAEISERELLKLRQQFGMVFQEGALFDSLSVAENVGFFLKENLRLPTKVVQERVLDKMKLLGLERFLDYYPTELSGGMKKRVAIARAIVTNPKGLLYDEPTAGLDPFSASRVIELIENLRQCFQVTSLIVSHEIHYFLNVVDRLLMLKNGQIAYDGVPDLDIANQFEENDEPNQCETKVGDYGALW